VAAEDEGGDVFDGDVELLGDEGAEAGRVEDAGHADDALAVELRLSVGGLGHRVERVRHDDEDGVRRVGGDFADDVGHDLVVGLQEVVAAHARLARDASGDDDDVGVGGVGIVVGADDVRVALLNGHGLEQVESFALGDAFDDIDEDDVGELLGGDPVGGGGSYVAGSDDGDFFAHWCSLFSYESIALYEAKSRSFAFPFATLRVCSG
jgi:hypothetical protein